MVLGEGDRLCGGGCSVEGRGNCRVCSAVSGDRGDLGLEDFAVTETSLLIANQKLEKAKKDIAVLRELVDYTIAIITAAGGRVEVPADKLDDWSSREWRHENDGVTHVFTTKAKPS